MPGTLSSAWLLRASGPIYLRTPHSDLGVEPQHPLRCACKTQRDRLIVADGDRIELFCECGRRETLTGTALRDVVALVEAEPVQPEWQTLEDALRALGYASDARRRAKHSHAWPRFPSLSAFRRPQARAHR
ncbi:MAG TPA: hypothetical protein VGM10_02995 [Actinocrinis sp.]